MLTIIDLAGDGISDYMINQGAYSCDGGGESIYSGSGGSQVIVYVGTSTEQAYLAFSSGVYEAKINKATNPMGLQVIVRGPLCGQPETENLPNSKLKAC